MPRLQREAQPGIFGRELEARHSTGARQLFRLASTCDEFRRDAASRQQNTNREKVDMTIRKTAEGRTIHGFKMKLYPGFAKEYEKRHNELWPEMADMIHEYGGHNYSIFIDEEPTFCLVISSLMIQSVMTNPPTLKFVKNGGISWQALWKQTRTIPLFL